VVAQGDRENLPRSRIFAQMWELAHDALGLRAPLLTAAEFGLPVARLSEPWYCCAEPTEQQLQSF